jgi:hypothetical protein
MLPARDTVVKVGVVASGAWKFEVASTGSGWITAQKFTTNSKDSLQITITANTGTAVRTSKVTVSLQDGTQPKDITLTQTYPGAAPTLELENPVSGAFTFANAADTVLKPVIVTFSSWSAALQGTASWVTLEKTVGVGKDTLRLTVTPNTTTAARTATVRVTVPGTTLQKDITITQNPAPVTTTPTLRVTPTSYMVTTTKDTTLKPLVEASADWSATVQGGATWLTVTKKTGVGGKDTALIQLPSPNTTASSRTATVRITSGTLTQDVMVTQGVYTPPVTCVDCYTTVTKDPIMSQQKLVVARYNLTSAATSDKVVFSFGEGPSSSAHSIYDVYTISSKAWDIQTVSYSTDYSYAPFKSIVANDKVYVVDNQNLSSYNLLHPFGSSTPIQLALRGDGAIGAANGKILIAGGSDNTASFSTKVEIVDATSNTLTSTTSLGSGVGRRQIASIALGDLIYFAGGRVSSGYSNVVDIYNTHTTSGSPWSMATLPATNKIVSAAVIGTRVCFLSSSNIYIYNPNNTSSPWQTVSLPTDYYVGSSAYIDRICVGAKNLLFISSVFDANTNQLTDNILVYDSNTNSFLSPIKMSRARQLLTMAVADNKLFIAGGQLPDGSAANDIDVYNLGK